jgi:hypothetical protein
VTPGLPSWPTPLQTLGLGLAHTLAFPFLSFKNINEGLRDNDYGTSNEKKIIIKAKNDCEQIGISKRNYVQTINNNT